MIPNRGRVYFALDGDNFNPDAVTEMLGILPTRTIHREDSIIRRPLQNASWQLSSDEVADSANHILSVELLTDSVISRLVSVESQIRDAIALWGLAPRLEVILWISTHPEHSTPIFGFSQRCISFLGSIGAYIDIDTYLNDT
jgi:hypothetical protein